MPLLWTFVERAENHRATVVTNMPRRQRWRSLNPTEGRRLESVEKTSSTANGIAEKDTAIPF
jgi:hypothetical protein